MFVTQYNSDPWPLKNVVGIDHYSKSNYGNYVMKTRELKITRIGNSRGVRLPADTLRRYHIGAVVRMEERAEGILLHPTRPMADKLSWEDTAREMAVSGEDWSEWDAVAGDGRENIPWNHPSSVLAEPRATYGLKPRGGRRKHPPS